MHTHKKTAPKREPTPLEANENPGPFAFALAQTLSAHGINKLPETTSDLNKLRRTTLSIVKKQ